MRSVRVSIAVALVFAFGMQPSAAVLMDPVSREPDWKVVATDSPLAPLFGLADRRDQPYLVNTGDGLTHAGIAQAPVDQDAFNRWYASAPADDRDRDGREDLFLLLVPLSSTDRAQTRTILLSGANGSILADQRFDGQITRPLYWPGLGTTKDSMTFLNIKEREFFSVEGGRFVATNTSLLGTGSTDLHVAWEVPGRMEVEEDGSGSLTGFIVGRPFRLPDHREAMGVSQYTYNWTDDPLSGDRTAQSTFVVETVTGRVLHRFEPGLVAPIPVGEQNVTTVVGPGADGGVIATSTSDWTTSWTLDSSSVGGPYTEIQAVQWRGKNALLALRQHEDASFSGTLATDEGTVRWSSDLPGLDRFHLPGGVDASTGSSVMTTLYARWHANDTVSTGWGMVDLDNGATRWKTEKHLEGPDFGYYLAPYSGDQDADGLTDMVVRASEHECWLEEEPTLYCYAAIVSGNDGSIMNDFRDFDYEGSSLLAFGVPTMEVDRFGTYHQDFYNIWGAWWQRIYLGVYDPKTNHYTGHEVDDRFFGPVYGRAHWSWGSLDVFGEKHQRTYSLWSHHGGPSVTSEIRAEYASTGVAVVDLERNEIAWKFETDAPLDVRDPPRP